jgi:hypothetical protein
MTREELRLECLKLVQQTANASGILLASGEIILRARAYADFVMDRSGHSRVVQANGAQNLGSALKEGSRVPAAPASQFELGTFVGAARTEQFGPPHKVKMGSPRRR